jgi:hypothetical protein
MITYEKIDDDTYKKVATTEEVYKISELQGEIEILENSIKEVKFIEYPKGASDDMKEVIDELNYRRQLNKEFFIEDKQRKEELLNKLENV